MRLLLPAAVLLAAGGVLAQAPAQRELNDLTGAPPRTRCFRSIELAQELSRHYVASGMCPQLRPVSAVRFVNTAYALKAADVDFLSDACHVQLKLMFRAGREWVAQDLERNCAETADQMRRNDFLKEFVKSRE